MYARLVVAAAALAVVAAECANGCSGHGMCREHDQCTCEPYYTGADCSQRVCPFDFAFVDIPAGDLNHDGLLTSDTYVSFSDGFSSLNAFPAYELFPSDATKGLFAAQDGEGHFYMECSGQGDCDRGTGECQCYPGYTGSGCRRTACPNDCSGHGLCRTLKEVATGALSRRAVGGAGGNMQLAGVRNAFDYSLWDADKHQMCICDSGYEGIDCSMRTCPRGDDPLTPSSGTGSERWCGGKACTYEIQEFRLSSDGPTSYQFDFIDVRNFTMTSYFTVNTATGLPGYVEDPSADLPGPSTNAGIIQDALRNVAGGALQRVEVRALSDDRTLIEHRTFQVTFVGLSGDQYLCSLTTISGKGKVEDGPKEFKRGNMEDIECSGRGLCDRANGLCKCFGGYFGVACEFQNALASGA